MRSILRFRRSAAVLGAVAMLAGLSGCIVAPAYPSYGYGGGYYAPPVVVSPSFGFYGGGWGGGGGRYWRR